MSILLSAEIACIQYAHPCNLNHEHGSSQHMTYTLLAKLKGKQSNNLGKATSIITPKFDSIHFYLLMVVDGLDLVHSIYQIVFIVQHLFHCYVTVTSFICQLRD